MPWSLIGEGSFNSAFRDGNSVFKVTQENKKPNESTPIDTMDNYARSVRLWNEVNPNLKPPAYIHETTIGQKKVIGWVCPFIEGTQASDDEICQKLIEIYNHTGRIIVDASSPKNFIKTPSGEIVCVDIGMAVQLEKRDDIALIGLRRKPSFSSLDTWHHMIDSYSNYFADIGIQTFTPKTVTIIKALLFIKDKRPDISDVNFLSSNPSTVSALAQAYDMEHPLSGAAIPSMLNKDYVINYAQQLLLQQNNLRLEETKQYCRQKILQCLPTMTSKDDNEAFYARYALDLISRVNQCQTIKDIQGVLNTIQDIEDRTPQEESKIDPMSDEETDTELDIENTPIRQLNQQLLAQATPLSDVTKTKEHCFTILRQFLHQHTQTKQETLQELKTTLSDSPQEKVVYYKKALANEKISELEKQVIVLIKWIDGANTLEEIDEFLLKFEASLLPDQKPSFKARVVDAIKSVLSPTPEKRLAQSISQCKLVLAAAKLSLEQENSNKYNPDGLNMV